MSAPLVLPDWPPTLPDGTHYVPDLWDFQRPALCQQALGITDQRSLGEGHWYTAARAQVTCPACLEWLHA